MMTVQLSQVVLPGFIPAVYLLLISNRLQTLWCIYGWPKYMAAGMTYNFLFQVLGAVEISSVFSPRIIFLLIYPSRQLHVQS